MCGIFGYIGNNNACDIIIKGLKRLEYRGYDSWGVAIQSNDKIFSTKNIGEIGNIKSLNLPKSNIGIGHTRWATCGKVTQQNAHPHFSTNKTFTLAHNGIVENFKELKDNLINKGYSFISETDTEVIVKLIEDKLKENKDFKTAIRKAFLKLEGRNTIIILKSNSKEIYAIRNGSPLVIGINKENNETFLSSDTLSFAPFSKKMIIIDNNHLVHINNNIKIFNLESDNEIEKKIEDINIKSDKVDKEGFDHFMIKEINENPFVIKQITLIDQDKYEKLANEIKNAKKVYVIGSGTAGIAAAQIAYYLRTYGKIKALNLVGGDAREYFNLFEKGDLIIAPSQSGETADVLEVLEAAKPLGVKIASHVNMPGSAMTRMSDYKFMANAGPEICVMSTKIFVSQIAWGYLLAKTIENKYEEGKNNLLNLVTEMTKYLQNNKNMQEIKDLSKLLKEKNDIFLMGKSQNLQIMNEGMIKLIEGTYKHAHSIPASDLKHYAITLMEEGVPVIATVSNDNVKSDLLNAISEVKARGAKVIAISSEKNEIFDHLITVPNFKETSAIMNVVPLQLLSYYLTISLGNNVDKPRNIAKSVTVK